MFVKNYINYASQNIIIGSPTYDAHSSEQHFVFNGNNYTLNSISFNLDRVDLIIGTYYGDIIKDVPLYIIKSKKEDIYILFTLKSNNSINISVNSKPNLENSVSIVNVYGSYFDRRTWFIALTPKYIALIGNFRLTTNNASGLGLTLDSIKNFMGEIEITNFSNIYGNASDSGGYVGGSFDNSSDTITIPNTPSIGVTKVGFVNVYAPSLNNLLNFGAELFPLFDNPYYDEDLTDITDPTALEKALAQSNIYQFNILKNLYNSFTNSKLIDFVLDCHCIPVTPTLSPNEKIKVGYKEFETQSPKVNIDYVDFDCGVLNIEEYYANFIDYVGTRAKLFLPFIGFVDIQPEYFQSGLLQVIYRFNIIDGSFMAYVLSSSSKSQLANTVIASYGGNACVHLPITSTNYSTMISSVLNGTAGVISGLTHGNVIGALNSALNTLSSKPDIQASNGYNSSSAYLSIRYPYLIIEREVSNFSEKYTSEYGLPCNITKTINDLSGFVQMDNIHLETLSCTDDEKTLIQNLLQNGIIV